MVNTAFLVQSVSHYLGLNLSIGSIHPVYAPSLLQPPHQTRTDSPPYQLPLQPHSSRPENLQHDEVGTRERNSASTDQHENTQYSNQQSYPLHGYSPYHQPYYHPYPYQVYPWQSYPYNAYQNSSNHQTYPPNSNQHSHRNSNQITNQNRNQVTSGSISPNQINDEDQAVFFHSGKLNRPSLIYRGHKFNFNKNHTKSDGETVTYLYCSQKKQPPLGCCCKASATAIKEIDPENHETDGEIQYSYTFIKAGNHTHPPCVVLKQIIECKRAMQDRVHKRPTEKPSRIYREEVDKIRDNLDEASKREFDQEMPTLQQLRPSIQRWRRDVVPPNPTTCSEIETDGVWAKLPSGENTIKGDTCVNGNPDKRILLQTSVKVLGECLRMSIKVVMDATFKCRSKLYPQLFVISFLIGNVCWRPAIYCHMPGR